MMRGNLFCVNLTTHLEMKADNYLKEFLLDILDISYKNNPKLRKCKNYLTNYF